MPGAEYGVIGAWKVWKSNGWRVGVCAKQGRQRAERIGDSKGNLKKEWTKEKNLH